MPSPLARCIACGRHVYAAERSCPFCGISRTTKKAAAAALAAGIVTLGGYGCAYGSPDPDLRDSGRSPADAQVNAGDAGDEDASDAGLTERD